MHADLKNTPMGEDVAGTKKQAENPRARAQQAPGGPPAAAAGPGAEIETQTEVVETTTTAETEPVGEVGEAMVQLLARRAALPRKVVDAIERALEAKRWSYCRDTKQRVYEDDHRAQMEAAKLYLEYVVGRPVERELVVTDGKGQGFSLDDLMASSALRRALTRRLQMAEGGVFGNGGAP